jgi:RimJ/RimL family protein N-acetyltransferase
MTEEGFAKYIERTTEDYAQAIARNFRRPIDETRLEAKEQSKRLLKDGLNTMGHLLYDVTDKDTGDAIGGVWVNVDDVKKTAFLYDIFVQERFRGTGYGSSILKLLDEMLKGMNIPSIGLHVFADNTVAINLYKKRGFHTASFNMHKEL